MKRRGFLKALCATAPVVVVGPAIAADLLKDHVSRRITDIEPNQFPLVGLLDRIHDQGNTYCYHHDASMMEMQRYMKMVDHLFCFGSKPAQEKYLYGGKSLIDGL